MRKAKLVVVLAVFLCIAFILPTSNQSLFGQIELINNSTNNNSGIVSTPINNMTTSSSDNATGIMENTSGVIDDAIGAFKDTFKSIFGK